MNWPVKCTREDKIPQDRHTVAVVKTTPVSTEIVRHVPNVHKVWNVCITLHVVAKIHLKSFVVAKYSMKNMTLFHLEPKATYILYYVYHVFI